MEIYCCFICSNFVLVVQGNALFGYWGVPCRNPWSLFRWLGDRVDAFITRSGRKVALRIWTPAQDVPKTAHAMYSLKAAMKWDEDVGFFSFKRLLVLISNFFN